MRKKRDIIIKIIFIAIISLYISGCSGGSGTGNSPLLNTKNGSITGLVVNKNNAPFEGLTIALYNSNGNIYNNLTTRSDSNGQYYFTGIPEGEYCVGIDGYNGTKPQISVSSGNSVTASKITVTSNVNITDAILCSVNANFREGISDDPALYAYTRIVDNNGLPIADARPVIIHNGVSTSMFNWGNGDGVCDLYIRPLDRGEYKFSIEGAPSVTRTYLCEELMPRPGAITVNPNPVSLNQPFTITWPAVEGALAYKVNVFRPDNIVVPLFSTYFIDTTTCQVPANSFTMPFSDYFIIRVLAYGSYVVPLTSITQLTKSSFLETLVTIE